MLSSIIFSLVFLLIFALCIYIAVKRSWIKSLLALLVNILSFIEAFLASRFFTGLFGAGISEQLKEGFLELLNLRNDIMLREDAMLRVSSFAVTIILSMGSFILFFAIFLLVNHLIKSLLFRLFSGMKYSAFKPEKKLWGLSVPLSLISFIVVSFAILYPLGAASNIVQAAAKSCDYDLQTSLLTNPVSKVYGLVGRTYFDKLTEIENSYEFINSEEAEYGTEIYLCVKKVTKGKDTDGKSIEYIAGSMRSSYLMTDFSSELVANAANSWKNGRKFMNRTVKIPEGRNGELVTDILEILSGWQRENLVQDIDTAINIYKLLKENEINKISDSTALMTALSDEQFCEKLFLELSGNDDFIAVIPKVMRFGIGSAVDAMNLEMNDEYIVEFNAKELTEEEWKREAAAFSTLLKRMAAMSGENKEFDVVGFLADLYEMRDSKLLSNMLLNLLIQILSNIQLSNIFG